MSATIDNADALIDSPVLAEAVVDDGAGLTPEYAVNHLAGRDIHVERRRWQDVLGSVFKYAVLIAAAIIAILPIVVLVFAAFKDSHEIVESGALQMPHNWGNFENFRIAFFEGNMIRGFRNTLIIFVVSIAGQLLLGTMISYVLHRFDFKLKKVIMALFLIATLVPAVTTQVATFRIIDGMGLFNTIWSVIILNLGTNVVAVYIFLQYLDTIPISLDEAALIDGASYFRIFRSIILPLLIAPMITVLIISGVGIYNDFYNPFLYMPSNNLRVISTTLFAFSGQYGNAWEIISAGVLLIIIPILIIFLVLQKYIYNGVAGSVK